MGKATRAIPSIARLVLIASMVFGLALVIEASDSSTVNIGANQSITAFSTCKKVTNNSSTGLSVYVPTTLASEWSSFYTSPPSGVTAGSCGCALPWGGTISDGQSVTAYQASSVPLGSTCVSETRACSGTVLSGSYQYASCTTPSCAGAAAGGYCWYKAAKSQSCDALCSSHGGCNAAGVLAAGTSNATCDVAGTALGVPNFAGTTNLTLKEGCYDDLHAETARDTSGAICSATHNNLLRICACNN